MYGIQIIHVTSLSFLVNVIMRDDYRGYYEKKKPPPAQGKRWLNVTYEGSNAVCKKASHGNKTELYSVTCLHTMLEICAHSGGLPIRYKEII